ncbi:hypothetical protein Y032_0027g1508 [Ancylostoma ceylanicum]|uniref:Uncharacterized protein n=1 Tax=Ancylostoma ceylanicum TaxID=53326 RepID=A0A016UUB1_9BILA|nr:hypothetical protein Y032_0027g1508 [Ancylostoma ceylanicum]
MVPTKGSDQSAEMSNDENSRLPPPPEPHRNEVQHYSEDIRSDQLRQILPERRFSSSPLQPVFRRWPSCPGLNLRQFILVRHTKGDTRIRVSPDFATTAGGRHMDKVKEETPGERGDELRLAAIYGDVK